MKSENVNEATYTGKVVVSRKGGKLGAVLIDPKTGKPIPGSWKPEKDVPGGIPQANKSAFFKAEADKIRSAEKDRLSKIGGTKPTPPSPPASRPSGGTTSSTTPAATAPSTAPAKPSAPASAAPKSSPVADYMKAAAAARQSGDPAQMAKVRDMGMDIWRKSNPKLAAAADERARIRGTAQTDNPLMKDMRSRLPVTPTVQAPAVKDLGAGQQSLSQNQYAGRSPEPVKPAISPSSTFSAKSTPQMNKSAETLSKDPLTKKTQKEAYDIVLDYIISEGHADTLSEAHYVMLQMDSEHIQNIVQERWSWNPMDWGKPEATPKNIAREKPARGYNPNTGTTSFGTKLTGYKDKVVASRAGVPGAMVKGKPGTWAPLDTKSNDPGVRSAIARYRVLRGTDQLIKDVMNNDYVSTSTKDFDRRYNIPPANSTTPAAAPRSTPSPSTTPKLSVRSTAPKPAAKSTPAAPKPQPLTIQSKNVTAGGTSYERRTPTSAELAASKAAGGGEAGIKAAVDVAKSNKVAATTPTPDLKPEAPKRQSIADTVKELQAMRKSSEERQK